MTESGGTRGMGAVFIAAAVAMFAAQIGMPLWQIAIVTGLVSVGLPIVITGKWSGW
jgi:hypothetical protein